MASLSVSHVEYQSAPNSVLHERLAALQNHSLKYCRLFHRACTKHNQTGRRKRSSASDEGATGVTSHCLAPKIWDCEMTVNLTACIRFTIVGLIQSDFSFSPTGIEHAIDEFLITWWPWKQVQLYGHLDWLYFDIFGSEGIIKSFNARVCAIVQRSRGIKT